MTQDFGMLGGIGTGQVKDSNMAGIIRTAQELATDATPLTFGKYRGLTPDYVAEKDPSYIVWAYGTITNRVVCSFPLAKKCGFIDLIGRDPSARNLPLSDSNENRRKNPYSKDPDHDYGYEDMDDDLPF